MNGLPRKLGRGRPSEAAKAQYQEELSQFCDFILEIDSSLDFKVSSRGWAYLLEGEGFIDKSQFDEAQNLINDCRKSGMLPLGICSEDSSRALINPYPAIDLDGPDDFADFCIRRIIHGLVPQYQPFSQWDRLGVYVEMLVEKIDLLGLFEPVLRQFHVSCTNSKGWSDLNTRGGLIERLQHQAARGNQCVLLYCGDHDPAGLFISDSIRKNLQDLSQATCGPPPEVTIERFGLNYDFIESQGLTWVDNLITGSGKDLTSKDHGHRNKPYVQSYLKQFGKRKCEANALVTRVDAGRQLCRDAIEKYISLADVESIDRELDAERQQVITEIPSAVERWLNA